MLERVKRFLFEVRAEFKKVSWPSKAEAITLTTLVILMIVVLTLYIGAWDFLFQQVIRYLLER